MQLVIVGMNAWIPPYDECILLQESWEMCCNDQAYHPVWCEVVCVCIDKDIGLESCHVTC